MVNDWKPLFGQLIVKINPILADHQQGTFRSVLPQTSEVTALRATAGEANSPKIDNHQEASHSWKQSSTE